MAIKKQQGVFQSLLICWVSSPNSLPVIDGANITQELKVLVGKTENNKAVQNLWLERNKMERSFMF
jgi:nucleoside diphosphate kinase